MKKPVMYLIANKGLGMSPGKLAAQVAHAAVKAYEMSPEDFIEQWNDSGHTKIVLEARDTEHLLCVREYLTDKGFDGYLVIDEGRTEIAPHTPTVLGMSLVDKVDEQVQFAFSDLRTYKEETLKELRDQVQDLVEVVREVDPAVAEAIVLRSQLRREAARG